MQQHHRRDDSTCIRKDPCPACDSRDNLGVYDDGHAFCFGCQHYIHKYEGDEVGERSEEDEAAVGCGDSADWDGSAAAPLVSRSALIAGEVCALGKRGITEATCAKFKYLTGKDGKRSVQIAQYFRDNKVVAQKLRYKNKDFSVVGAERKDLPLFGQWLWRDAGKMLVITEGEIDAMSVSQVQGNKWPVVSLPAGAGSAVKAIRTNLEWVESYEKVILMFDMDEPGQEAAKKVAEILKPGKAAIAVLPLKDANDMLVAGRTEELVSAMWGAKVYRPDGILAGAELWTKFTTDKPFSSSVQYPWAELNAKTLGIRRTELVTLTAGSGIGKSAVCRELAHHLLKEGETVGYIALEESVERTSMGIMGIDMDKPIHLDTRDWSELDAEEQAARKQAFDNTIGTGRAFLYDDWGSVDVDTILSRIRYLARGCGCGWVFLDHLSILVSGMQTDNERRAIDEAMTALRSLVEETDIGLILVSHLRRPQGDRGHEDGAETHLSQLRGSHAIAQLSDIVIGFERDQQDEDESNVLTCRVLKNRFSGQTGEAGRLLFTPETGRLTPYEYEYVAPQPGDEF